MSTVRPQINADDWTLIINRTGRGDEGRWVEVTVTSIILSSAVND